MAVLALVVLVLGGLGLAAAALLLTAESWLLPLLNWLDARLAAIGFGKWSAGLLTRAEEYFRKKSEV